MILKDTTTSDCKHDLYIEEYERFHGECDGSYVVMCMNCGWADKYVYSLYDDAGNRQTILEDESKEKETP